MYRRINKQLIFSTCNKSGNISECWELIIKSFRYKVTLNCIHFKKEDHPVEKILFIDFIPMETGAVYEKNINYDAKRVISSIVSMITNCVFRLNINIVTFHVLNARKSLIKIYERYAKRYGQPVDCQEILDFVHKRSPFRDRETAKEFTFYVR
jgi:hypothetical protein